MKSTIRIIAAALCFVLIGAFIASTLAGADTSATLDPGWTTAPLPTEPKGDDTAALDDMRQLLGGLGRSEILRMIIFLTTTDGTFADWLRQEYGDRVEIPESLEDLETGEYVAIAMRLFGIKYDEYMGVTTTAKDQTETTTGFVFPPIDRPTVAPGTTAHAELDTPSAQAPSTTGLYMELTVIHPETNAAPVTVPESGSGEIPAGLVPGDVNWDGKVLADDARLALRISARLENPSPAAMAAADVNGDRYVLADDARQILRYSARLQKTFDRAEPASEQISEQ